MRRMLVAVALVLLVLAAGCAGLSSGDDGTGANATEGTQPTADGEPDDQRSASLDEPHPHVESGTLSFSSLGREHLATLREMETFALTDTVTVTNVADGSIRTRVTTEKRFDLAGERLLVEQRQETGNGGLVQALYRNATTQCTHQSGSTQCREEAFAVEQALGRVVEITSLETAGAPAFSPNGTTTVDGEPVYRFSADSLREDPPEQSRSELDGQNPTIESATLLVSPDGAIVRYDVRYTVDADSGRARVERRYRITPTDGSSISPPEWLSS